jgi:hypothetical protein
MGCTTRRDPGFAGPVLGNDDFERFLPSLSQTRFGLGLGRGLRASEGYLDLVDFGVHWHSRRLEGRPEVWSGLPAFLGKSGRLVCGGFGFAEFRNDAELLHKP